MNSKYCFPARENTAKPFLSGTTKAPDNSSEAIWRQVFGRLGEIFAQYLRFYGATAVAMRVYASTAGPMGVARTLPHASGNEAEYCWCEPDRPGRYGVSGAPTYAGPPETSRLLVNKTQDAAYAKPAASATSAMMAAAPLSRMPSCGSGRPDAHKWHSTAVIVDGRRYRQKVRARAEPSAAGGPVGNAQGPAHRPAAAARGLKPKWVSRSITSLRQKSRIADVACRLNISTRSSMGGFLTEPHIPNAAARPLN